MTIEDPRFQEANRWQSWCLDRLGLIAIAMPWGKVYAKPEVFLDEEMRIHEGVHIDQMHREGGFVFTIKYLWFLVIYGYRENPYEVEAYKISDGYAHDGDEEDAQKP